MAGIESNRCQPLGGYCLIECEDQSEAVSVALRIPSLVLIYSHIGI
jgi:hypothetical protein